MASGLVSLRDDSHGIVQIHREASANSGSDQALQPQVSRDLVGDEIQRYIL